MFWFKESKFIIASDIFIKYTFITLENSFKLYTKCCIINANMVTTHPLRILLIFHPSFLMSFQIPLRTICNLELETQIKIIDQQKISRITLHFWKIETSTCNTVFYAKCFQNMFLSGIKIKLGIHSCLKKKQWIKNGGNLSIHCEIKSCCFNIGDENKLPNIAIRHAKFDYQNGSIHVICTRLKKPSRLHVHCSNIIICEQKRWVMLIFPSDCSYTSINLIVH